MEFDLSQWLCEALSGWGVPAAVTQTAVVPLLSFVALRLTEWMAKKGWCAARGALAGKKKPAVVEHAKDAPAPKVEEAELVLDADCATFEVAAPPGPPSPALKAFLSALYSDAADWDGEKSLLSAPGVEVVFDGDDQVGEVLTAEGDLRDGLEFGEWEAVRTEAHARRYEVRRRDRERLNLRMAAGLDDARKKAARPAAPAAKIGDRIVLPIAGVGEVGYVWTGAGYEAEPVAVAADTFGNPVAPWPPLPPLVKHAQKKGA